VAQAWAAIVANAGASAKSTMTGLIGFGVVRTYLCATSGDSGTVTDSSGPDGRLLNGAAKVDRGDGMKATASLGISLVGSFGKQNFGGVYLHHTF
jgi:hypothetical protein